MSLQLSSMLPGTMLPSGPPGATGPQGVQGAQGGQGPQGVAGPTGSVGPATWASAIPWSSGLTCISTAPATTVTFNGSLYSCSVSHITGASFDATKWQLILSAGALQAWTETLTVTAPNTLSPITYSWSGVFAIVFVNGQAFFQPSFSITGATVTWSPSNSGIALATTDAVSVFYSIARSPLAVISSYRLVTTAGAVAVNPGDSVILLQKSPSGTSTINLTTSATSGGPVLIKDMTGDASTNLITIVPQSGETINGLSASAALALGMTLIDIDYGSQTYYPLSSGGWYTK